MMSTSSHLSAAALVASLMLGGSLSAEAAPLFVPPAATAASSNIITVEGAGAGPNEAASAPQFDRRGRLVPESQQGRDRGRTFDSARGDSRRGFERRGGDVYYNGHRGYRDRRSGYRYHEGYWFPLAAFDAGAIIGGAIVGSPPPAPASNPHIDWCLSRYRSYDPYDNTFQPYRGPRVDCRSPYG